MSVDETITFSLAVKNTGNRERQEIVQLYIRDIKSSLPRPVKELKRFIIAASAMDIKDVLKFELK